MKNNTFAKRMKSMSGFLLAMILFVACAPVSFVGATVLGLGTLAMNSPMIMKYIPMPSMSFGINPPTPEETEAALLKKVKDAAMAGVDAKWLELLGSNPELKSMKELVEKMKVAKTDEEITALKAELDKVALSVKAIKDTPVKGERGLSLDEALVKAFAEKKDEIDAIVKSGGKQSKSLEIEIKAVGTMSVASTIGAGATQVTITEDTGIISNIRKREMTYLANVSVGSISANRAVWIEETDEEGNPIFIAEGATKTQLDVQYLEQVENVKKIAVFGKVTTELMADIPQLISHIKNNLMRRMDIVLENQLFTGTGAGDNLQGVIPLATAFAAGGLADTIVDANNYDVIEAVAKQVEIAFGNPNVMFIHPTDYAKMLLLKDANGQYIYPRWASSDGLVVAGMKIIKTTAMTEGDFVGGDFSVVQVRIREELGIQIGLDGNDFTKNLKTMLLEKRLVQFVSANDTQVLVKGTFVDAIADLDTVLT